jgi:glyoxylase-like metal-dependent hydrolase (beta-lactamase superfamily II)
VNRPNLVVVLPDLYQLEIPTPFPVGPVNIYVARAPEGLTLVDCGPRTREARVALDAGLAALGSSVHDVRRILVTHAHADHYGLAASIAADAPPGARVFTHPFNRPTLEAYDQERKRHMAFYADLLRVSGVPEETRRAIERARQGIGDYAERIPVAGDLNDGDALALAGREWRVLHTPGHSSGLVCLYEPQSRTLLSNDHLLRDISSNPLVEPPPPGRAERFKSLVEYLRQMQRVAAMDVSIAWPGHGEPIHDVPGLVRQRVEFHARRAGRILELLDGHRLTTYQVVRPLFPRLDSINFFLAISEVLGHLELLELEGRVQPAQRNGVTIWQATTPGS